MMSDDELRQQSAVDRIDSLFDDAERYSVDAWNANDVPASVRWFRFAKELGAARRVLTDHDART